MIFFRGLTRICSGLSRLIILVGVTACLIGCVTAPPPKEDYTLAKAAIDAARAVQSARYSPGYWHQADEAYRQARILYNEREYEDARALFITARQAAEKAENSARLLRQKNGDIL